MLSSNSLGNKGASNAYKQIGGGKSENIFFCTINSAVFKALKLLGPSTFAAPFLQDFRGIPQKFGVSGSTEQIATDESIVIKERGDTEVTAAILGRHQKAYKWPGNSCVVLKSLFCE